MKKIFVMIFLLTVVWAEGDKKVVLDLTTGSIKDFETKVLSGIAHTKAHYENRLETLHVAVVIHGKAYKFFVKNLEAFPFKSDSELKSRKTALAKRIKSLVSIYEVEFLMCQSGASKYNISAKDLYEGIHMTPNAAIGLIDKQNEGYAYLPIH